MLGLRLRMTPSDRLMQRLGSYIEMHLFKGGYLGVVLQENESANFCMAVRKSRLAAAKGSPAILFAQLADENPALGERLSALTATQHVDAIGRVPYGWRRSEEPTSELQSLMRISYAVFCLKKQNKTHNIHKR